MDAAYDDQVYVDDRTIDSHIKRMRKKFREVDPEFDAIETLYGVGYRYRGILSRRAFARAAVDRPPRRSRYRGLPGSRLGRLILALNLLGLAILIVGALVLNEVRRGPGQRAHRQPDHPGRADRQRSSTRPPRWASPSRRWTRPWPPSCCRPLSNPGPSGRGCSTAEGRLVADSDWMADEVERRDLPPARARGEKPGGFSLIAEAPGAPTARPGPASALADEVAAALHGPPPGPHAPRRQRRAGGLGLDPDPARAARCWAW